MNDLGKTLIPVVQGDHKVSRAPDAVLSTVLGSCIATCLYDPVAALGGMNHFLLPGSDPNAGSNVKYGAHAMEELVNAMLRSGAQRHRLEAQIFGGANVVKGLGSIGESNGAFAVDFVRCEGFQLRGTDIGGNAGRKLRFHPTTGVAQVEHLDPALVPPERRPRPMPQPNAQRASVELF